MVVAGIAVIRLDIVGGYIWVIVIVCAVGMIATYAYNRFVAVKLFGRYKEEQFLMMYGMLTGTASTGTILLREKDPKFKTPASENLIYQNFPAIVFGLPLMFIANFCPKNPLLTLVIMAVMFIVLNIILFREQIFKRRYKKVHAKLEENAKAAKRRALFKNREKRKNKK
jgi:ESS family glutamate:Na+ symporter